MDLSGVETGLPVMQESAPGWRLLLCRERGTLPATATERLLVEFSHSSLAYFYNHFQKEEFPVT